MVDYLRIADVKENQEVRVSGFTCISDENVTIKSHPMNGLYFECCEGRHYLDGQKWGDYYVGLFPVTD